MGKTTGKRPRVAMRYMATLAALLVVGTAEAGGLPAGLQGYLTQFQAGAVGMGVVLFAVGGVGWLGTKMDMVHSPVLSGVMPWIVHGGMYGGVVATATAIGLTAGGATLPL